jgi:hypothetical protein
LTFKLDFRPFSKDTVKLGLPEAFLAGAGLVLAGVIGYSAGNAIAPQPLPPPVTSVTKVIVASPKSLTEGRQAAASLPTSPLTIEEQRSRAELRVDRDKAKLLRLQEVIRSDEQRLAEYKRVEKQSGPDASAVRLVFPPPDSSIQ